MKFLKEKKTEEKKIREPLSLSGDYLSVGHENACSYGGSQNWFDGMLKRCGCGIIGAADLIWYLRNGRQPADQAQYERYIRKVRKSFHLIPFKGMPGFFGAFCLNSYMRKNKMPYKASWGCAPWLIRERITEMLSQDIPVLFCVGPGLHQMLKKPVDHGIKLYLKEEKTDVCGSENGEAKNEYTWVKTVRGHFMVLTGLDGEWGTVSSWGEKYYISLDELENYALHDGFGLLTNIVRVQRRDTV